MGRRAASIGGVLAAAAAALGQAPDLPAPPPTGPRTVTLQPGLPPPPVIPDTSPPDRFRPLAPFAPAPAGDDLPLPDGTAVDLPASGQGVRFSPRYGKPPSFVVDPLPDDSQRLLYTGGVIVNVVTADGGGDVEFAADNVVAWVKGAKKGQPPAGGLAADKPDGKMQVELYLSGDVVIRTRSGTAGRGGSPTDQVLRAEEIYYDVNRNRCIALAADLEMKTDALQDAVHFQGREIWRLGRNEWRGFRSELYSSKTPADPSLRLSSREFTYTQRMTRLRNVFGIPYRDIRTGQPVDGYEKVLTNRDVVTRILGVPVFYTPRYRTDLEDPLGPLAGIGFGNNNIFGTQFYTTWNLYKLLALKGPDGHTWNLNADYLSDRGLALGTDYNYTGPNLFGIGDRHRGSFRFYGIDDGGMDQIGGEREFNDSKPDYRYRVQARHNQDLYEDGTTFLRYTGQFAYLSDQNFLEQYYKNEFDAGPNQETFGYVYGGWGNAYGSLLFSGYPAQDWITQTRWLPRAEADLIGESLLDGMFVYTGRATAGYAKLRPSQNVPAPQIPTQQKIDTSRFDLNQELSAPFDLGPVRLAPYGVVDLTYYSNDLTGEDAGRFYGGGGVRGSSTVARLYPDARSEIFNVRGLNHKITVEGDYLAAYSNIPQGELPLLDRVGDDTDDLTYRWSRPYNRRRLDPPVAEFLGTSPLFDPQRYATRRQVEGRPELLDTIQVARVGVTQRLQTKRGPEGADHTVDWMTFNVAASLFPDPNRDNFGENWSFLEYYYQWHLGDRTSLSSAGWFDPFDLGARFWTVGANFSRPDGTNVYLAYRHTDPVGSRAFTAVLTYQMSRKYSVNLASTYDVGLEESLGHTLTFVRTGTDMTVSVGFTYNSLIRNFGFQFAISPNLSNLTPGRIFQNAGLGRR